jgi:hypothetical protein
MNIQYFHNDTHQAFRCGFLHEDALSYDQMLGFPKLKMSLFVVYYL